MRGTGTQQDPFLIDNLTDLNDVRNNLSAYYKVAAHIDATATQTWNNGAGFDPIDDFAGYFDGDFKNISGLYINRETSRNGLFGIIAEGATITKVILSNVNITGASNTGALVGRDVVNSTITKCCASGTVVGNGVNIGGLIGSAKDGTVVISECFSLVNVTGTGTATGGLIGAFGGTGSVQNCYAKGSVNGVPSIGAFIGSASNATIKYCYSVGPVSGTSGSYSTGFCGYGYNLTTGGTNFFDKKTTGKSSGFGATGKTTVQMHTISTYKGWDFDVVWQWNPANYPTLRNVPESYLVVTPEIPIEYSPYTRISYNPVGTLIEDELHTDVGAESFNLNHDTFYAGTDLEIWTGEGQTGTQLVQDTDYTVGDEDTRLSTKTTKNVFTSITITNAAYQTGDLYFTYRVVGDYVDAADYNFIEETLNEPYVDKNNHIMGSIWPWVNKKNNYSATVSTDASYPDSNAVYFDGEYIFIGLKDRIYRYNRETRLMEDSVQVNFRPSSIISDGTYIYGGGKKIDGNSMTVVGEYQAAPNKGTGHNLNQVFTVTDPGEYILSVVAKKTASDSCRIDLAGASGTVYIQIPQSSEFRKLAKEVYLNAGSHTVKTFMPVGSDGEVSAITVSKVNNLVTNGNFETGNVGNRIDTKGWLMKNVDGTTSSASWAVFDDDGHVHSGSKSCYVGPVSGGIEGMQFMKQTISNVPRGSYTFKFWVWPSSNYLCDRIRVYDDGVVIFEETNFTIDDVPSGGYSQWNLCSFPGIEVSATSNITIELGFWSADNQWIDDVSFTCDDYLVTDASLVNNLVINPTFSPTTGWNGSIAPSADNMGHESLAWDGQYLYSGNEYSSTISRWDTETLTKADIATTGSCNSLVYAHGYLWKASDTTVYKLAPGTLDVIASYTDPTMSTFRNKKLLVVDGMIYVFQKSSHLVLLKQDLTKVTDIYTYLDINNVLDAVADSESVYALSSTYGNVVKFRKLTPASVALELMGTKAITDGRKLCFDGNILYFVRGNGATNFNIYGVNKIGG